MANYSVSACNSKNNLINFSLSDVPKQHGASIAKQANANQCICCGIALIEKTSMFEGYISGKVFHGRKSDSAEIKRRIVLLLVYSLVSSPSLRTANAEN